MYICNLVVSCTSFCVCRPKGENVDVKALGDYDGGMSILIILYIII